VHAKRRPGVPRGGQPVLIAKDSAVGNVVAKVYDGRVAYCASKPESATHQLNQHPVAIEPTALRALLTRVQLPDSGNEPLFARPKLDESLRRSPCVARVVAEQDVSFAVSGQHGSLEADTAPATTVAFSLPRAA